MRSRQRRSEAMPKVMYRSKMFRVEKGSSEVKGRKFVFDRIVGPDTIMVLPVLKDGRIILERQYRHALSKYICELPAGHIDKGEKPDHAAVRELEEECGYRAGKLKFLFSAHPSPGSKTDLCFCFLAPKLLN